MSTQIKTRRGTTTEHNTFTGSEGEVTVDTTKDTLVVHDGATAGGHALAKEALVLPKAGGTMTGHTLHGDSVKAKFGAGGDLEIYHDGSNSYIKDVGTGNLSIQADTYLTLKSASATMLSAQSGAGVSVKYNGSEKLATTSTGIDVTGVVDVNTGSGTSPSYFNSFLNVQNNASTGNSSSLTITAGNAGYAGLHFGDAENGRIGQVAYSNADNALLFTANNSERMRIGSSGNVGIGTSSPAQKLHVDSGTGDTVALFESSGDAKAYLVIKDSGSSGGAFIGADGTHTILGTGGSTERMRIDSSGKVGIGTNSPTSPLHITGSGHTALTITGGTTSDAQIRFGDSSNTTIGMINYDNAINALKFVVNGSTAAIIDSSGRLLVGTATTGNTAYAATIQIASGTGGLYFRKYDATTNYPLTFRATSGANLGGVSVTETATSYNTSSDYRLKTDVQPMTGATATFKQLKPVNFEWIADGTRVDGFLAHELGEVIPAAATGSKDAMMDEEYEVSPATGDIYTAAISEVTTESQVMETVETGSYVNLAGETIVETTEQGMTTDLVETVVQRQDVDGVSTEVEVEVTTQVPTMETVITTEAVAEVIHSADVEKPETLEEGQAWRETTEAVMGTRSVPDMQGIDQAKVVPLMTATIQELIARIEALEA